jgi:RND family efflux transporter MFP subunit
MTHARRSASLALVASLGLAAGCGKAPETQAGDQSGAPQVAVVKVTLRNVTDNLEIASEFQPFQEIDAYAKVSGYIQKLYVDWGSHVKQGQLLAVLEIPELQQQIEEDQAAVHRSEQDLARAHEEVGRAESAYSVAHITYTRLADVQKTQPNLIAQQDIDVAQGKDIEANAGLSAAKDSVAAAEQGLAAVKAALEKDKDMFAYSRITAPFDAVVTQMNAYTGALLPAGTSSSKGDASLCRLSQNDLLRLVIPVPERAVASIHDGQTLEVDVSGLSKTFAGKIIRFSDQIDLATRTMHTEVQVPNPKYEIVPGMYASVKIPLTDAVNVATVPVEVVERSSGSQGTVLVVNSSNRIEKRNVTLGVQTANDVEVVSGLNAGDLVIFGEQNQYTVGELVSPKLMDASQMH